MMGRYRKKPVIIEAIRLTGATSDEEIIEFLGDATYEYDEAAIYIHTLEGVMRADVGDWIIRGVKGELYPCKQDIFEATYEEVVA
jgi:hypothetical protein